MNGNGPSPLWIQRKCGPKPRGGSWREEKIVHLPSILLPSDGGVVPTRRWWKREGERIIRGEWGETNSANGKEKGERKGRKGKVMDWEVPDSLSREIAGGHVMSSAVVLCGVINHISRQRMEKTTTTKNMNTCACDCDPRNTRT